MAAVPKRHYMMDFVFMVMNGGFGRIGGFGVQYSWCQGKVGPVRFMVPRAGRFCSVHGKGSLLFMVPRKGSLPFMEPRKSSVHQIHQFLPNHNSLP